MSSLSFLLVLYDLSSKNGTLDLSFEHRGVQDEYDNHVPYIRLRVLSIQRDFGEENCAQLACSNATLRTVWRTS